MNWIKQITSRPREWRRFGFTIGPILIGLGFWFGWRSQPMALAGCGGAGLLMLLLAWTSPSVLRLPYLLWMTIGLGLGTIVSTIFLTAFFLLLVSPFALLARLRGLDFLELKLDRSCSSYWKRRDPSQAPSPDRYERQF